MNECNCHDPEWHIIYLATNKQSRVWELQNDWELEYPTLDRVGYSTVSLAYIVSPLGAKHMLSKLAELAQHPNGRLITVDEMIASWADSLGHPVQLIRELYHPKTLRAYATKVTLAHEIDQHSLTSATSIRSGRTGRSPSGWLATEYPPLTAQVRLTEMSRGCAHRMIYADLKGAAVEERALLASCLGQLQSCTYTNDYVLRLKSSIEGQRINCDVVRLAWINKTYSL